MKTNSPPRVFAGLLILLALILLVAGARLILLGGSWYYALAGSVLAVSAALLWRGKPSGAWLYGGFLLATALWGVAEVGLDTWGLMPRLAMWLALGLWLLLPRTRRRLHTGEPLRPLFQLRSTRIFAVLSVLFILGLWWHARDVNPLPFARVAARSVSDAQWLHYGRTSAGTRYAPFADITPENVTRLKKTWEFRTGVTDVFKATPLQVGADLFFCTAANIIVAIDAETGKEHWRFDPKVNTNSIGFTTTCRGVTYYKSPAPLTQCSERILTATADARFFAVDAQDGKPCEDFGKHENKRGEVSLLVGMGEVLPGYYYVTSPATIARDVAVLGGWVLDNNRVEEPSGVIRGFDPITGQLKWAWDVGRPTAHTLPGPNETYTRGTPNAWSLFSADDELGLVYIPTGNATPDYFGAHRSKFAEQYASSVVALDVGTGDVRWSYQTTHHDIWDYDVPSQPVLTTMPDKQGVDTPAVIVPTKRGELFVFDRRNGTPLADIEERPAPKGAVPEDWTSPTQPFSTGMPSFGGAPLTEADTWGVTPFDQLACRIAFKSMHYEGPFTPPSTAGTIEYPGFAGGMNWGSVSVHEDARLLVVQSLHIANRVQLTPRAQVTDQTPVALGGPQTGTPYLAHSFPWLSPIFAPCQRPPYGELAVVDLRTRKTLWQRPLGTANELGPLGLKLKIPLPMGVPFSAGTVVTGSGLIFVSGTMDRYLRAIDLYTGRELWREYLPGQSQATPMSYLGPKSKRQFIVVTVPGKQGSIEHAGESGVVETESPDGGYVIAYAL